MVITSLLQEIIVFTLVTCSQINLLSLAVKKSQKALNKQIGNKDQIITDFYDDPPTQPYFMMV